jgi:hypothetical protein
MSELTNQIGKHPAFKDRLLATASAFALIGMASVSPVRAEDEADRPTVWIELGGQLERIEANQKAFAPDFTGQFESDGFLSPGQVERTPRYANGIEGKISIDPEDSSWIFSAAIRYGRSNTAKTSHNQVATPPVLHTTVSIPAFGFYRTGTAHPNALRFADSASRTDESHFILDFQAGRDVGLGVLKGTATIDAGVRIAQFTSRSHVNMTANPGGVVPYKYATQFYGNPAYIKRPYFGSETWDLYHATAAISRSFKGAGPSLSFEASLPLVGNPEAMQVNFDIGGNGALLFGRQKADVRHKTNDDRPVIPHVYNFIPMTPYYHHSYNRPRSRSVIVPNIGGFAGLSFNYANAKIKFGYRADFFFGAMDGGIDVRKTYDRNFYGPFATISIGLGG